MKQFPNRKGIIFANTQNVLKQVYISALFVSVILIFSFSFLSGVITPLSFSLPSTLKTGLPALFYAANPSVPLGSPLSVSDATPEKRPSEFPLLTLFVATPGYRPPDSPLLVFSRP
jgi:hypothetical protein